MTTNYNNIITQYGRIREDKEKEYINTLLNQVGDVFKIKYTLFNKRDLEEYTKHEAIKSHLQSYKDPYEIITLKEFLVFLKTNEVSDKDIFLILLSLTDKKCGNMVSPYYGALSFFNSIINSSEYECILAIQTKFRDFNYYNVETSKIIDCINGFVVAQKGECKKYPDMYTVRIICASKDFRSPVLLGAYILMAKWIYQDYGLLEVAGGHENLKALCAYDKFGFVETPDMHTDCFDDTEVDNLPLRLDLSTIELENIIDVINGKRHKQPPHELCGEFKPNPRASPDTEYKEKEYQKEIADLMKKRELRKVKTSRKTAKVEKIKSKIKKLKEKLRKTKKKGDGDSAEYGPPKTMAEIDEKLRTKKQEFMDVRYPKEAMPKNFGNPKSEFLPGSKSRSSSPNESIYSSDDSYRSDVSSVKIRQRAKAKTRQRSSSQTKRMEDLPSK